MDLNIDQLDSEERKKINALLRERNDVNKDKGVEYIFRQSDEREEFLLGKKIDLNKMVKDEKAMMGESESEFQERMEKRKLMQKMREDPMAIIQLNEQQAHKVALEKQKVHQKLSKLHNSKFRRKDSESTTDSDSSDCMDKLRELLEKQIDNDDDNPIMNILSKVNPKLSNKNQNIKQISTSPKMYNKRSELDSYKQNRDRKRSRSYNSLNMHKKRSELDSYKQNRDRKRSRSYNSPNMHKKRSQLGSYKQDRERKRSRSCNSPSISKKRNESDYYNPNKERKRSRSYSSSKGHKNQTLERKLSKNEKLHKNTNFRDNEQSKIVKHSKVEISSERPSKDKRHIHSRSRSPYTRHKSTHHRTESKSQLTKEQREQRLQEMKDNAQELDFAIQDLDRKFQKQDKKETEELKKNLKNSEEYMFKETVKLNSNISSLQSNLRERQKVKTVEKYFK